MDENGWYERDGTEFMAHDITEKDSLAALQALLVWWPKVFDKASVASLLYITLAIEAM